MSDKAAPLSAARVEHVVGRICHSPSDRCLGCDHYYGKSDVCKYAGERIRVVIFEDINGTRHIYSDAAVAAISGPGETDTVLTETYIYLTPNGVLSGGPKGPSDSNT